MRQIKLAQGNLDLNARIMLIAKHFIYAPFDTAALLRIVRDGRTDHGAFVKTRLGSAAGRCIHLHRMWKITVARCHHPARTFARKIADHARHGTFGDIHYPRLLTPACISRLAHERHGIAVHHAIE